MDLLVSDTSLTREQLEQWTAPANPLRRRRSLSYRSERRWLPVFRIHKTWSTWWRAKCSQCSTILNYSAVQRRFAEKRYYLARRTFLIFLFWSRSFVLSTVCFRFCLKLLIFVFKLKIVTCRIEIWVQWESHLRHGGLHHRPSEDVFFRQVEEAETLLCQEYRAKRGLYSEINSHFCKILVSLLEAK